MPRFIGCGRGGGTRTRTGDAHMLLMLARLPIPPCPDMARHEGVEPPPAVLETAALPLDQWRVASRRGVEPHPPEPESGVLPLNQREMWDNLKKRDVLAQPFGSVRLAFI